MWKRMQLAAAGFCFLAGTFFGVHAAQAGKPIPSGKDAPTDATWRAEQYARHQQDVALYKKNSQDPQAIRTAAAQFLDDYFKRLYYMPKAPSWEDLEKQADQLASQGVKDPFFQAIIGAVKARLGKTEESIAQSSSAVQRLTASKYPASIRFMACATWYSQAASNGNFRKEADAAKPEIASAFLEMAEETADKAEEQMHLWDLIFDLISPNWQHKTPSALAIQPVIFEAAEKAEKIHPWLKHMMLGHKHDFLGWQSRGIRLASMVTPEGWKGFQEHLTLAAEHLTKAWELDKKVPYAASTMISVAGGAEIGGVSAREWFDRAVEARMDYYQAYSSFFNYLQPKWGGSYPALRQFLDECAATKRNDTDVPFKFILFLHFLDADFGNRGEIWREEGVYETAKAVLEGMENEPSRSLESLEKRPLERILSFHGALATKVGKYAEARMIFDRLGDKLRQDAFSFIHCNDPIEFARVYAMTGAARAEVEKLEDLFSNGEMSDPATAKTAAELLEKAVSLTKEPQAKPYFDQRKTSLDWQTRFHQGEWVELTFDENFSMWERRTGNWSYVDPKTVTAHESPFGKPNRLVLTVPLPGPLEADFDMAGLEYSRSYKCGLGFGDTWNSSGPGGCAFWFLPRWRVSEVSAPNDNRNVFKEVEYAAHFHVQAWDGAYCFYVHDTEHPWFQMPNLTVGSHLELTTAGIKGEMAGDARFSNLRVRKLKKPAPPMGREADRVGYFTKLIEEDPNDGFLYYQRGQSHAAELEEKEAIADFRKALELSPDLAMAHLAWSRAAFNLGEMKESQEQLDEYLKRYPDDIFANLEKALVYATCEDKKFRNGKKAVQIAKKVSAACNNQNHSACHALACAYAESGDFKNAVKWAKEAARLAPPPKKKDMEARVALFQSKKPHRLPIPTPDKKPPAKDG
jgi:Flp pilus assembly protein TadD